MCGRKLSLVQSDDRFQSATNRSETEKLAGQVVAFAGSLSVVDEGGAPILDQKGWPTSPRHHAPSCGGQNSFSPNPTDPTPAPATARTRS